jgi:hypothetical protein
MVLTIQLLPWAQLPSYLVLSVVALCTFVVDGWEERRDLALVNGVVGTSVGSTLSMSKTIRFSRVSSMHPLVLSLAPTAVQFL